MDDIQAKLKEMSQLYSGLPEVSAAAPVKKEEVKVEEVKKPKRIKIKPPPPPGVSRITSRSEATLYVRSTMAELRNDAAKREEFASRVAQIEASQRRGTNELIRANVGHLTRGLWMQCSSLSG